VNIGIVCYASVGGSGIVATELAMALAERGHQVHLVSSDPPFRLGEYQGLRFHRVLTPTYPVFRGPQYLLSLANKLVELSGEYSLDLIHAHYAVPHAAAGYLARQILASVPGTRVPKIITTLHGTDITLLGPDPSYSRTVAFSINQSDGVTAVSESLKAETYRALPITREIRVIPNFLECSTYRRTPVPGLRDRMCPPDRYDRLIAHVSNFRPVKRIEAVIEVFRRVRERVRARLLLVGEGPELDAAQRLILEAGLSEHVELLGQRDQVVPLLSISDLFLLPSSQESFGLAALEAMACEVPVVASRVGGLPEVIEHGVTGFLEPPDDVEAMSRDAVALLTDPDLHRRVAAAGVRGVHRRFCTQLVVPRYIDYYAEVLASA
jgi:L-malate glycosyltransferase